MSIRFAREGHAQMRRYLLRAPLVLELGLDLGPQHDVEREAGPARPRFSGSGPRVGKVRVVLTSVVLGDVAP
jgi:hypothetical protein